MKNTHPPKITGWLLKLFSGGEQAEIMLHNLEEEYFEISEDKGKRKADSWYRRQVLKSIPKYSTSSFYWGGVMFKSYFTTALRNIKKYKGYSLINIVGLAVGLTCSLLIFLFVSHELSYDKYHEKSDRIYRLNLHVSFSGEPVYFASVAAPTAAAVVADYPEIEEAVRIYPDKNWYLKYNNNSFKEANVAYSDTTLFNVFDIPLLAGSKKDALAAPNTLVISESAAEKIFGNENPVGKQILLNGFDDYKVTGVFQNIPTNNHFHYDVIASLSSNKESYKLQWLNNISFYTYVVLKPTADPINLESKMQELFPKYVYTDYNVNDDFKKHAKFTLQLLTDIHLKSEAYEELEPNGSMATIYTFSAIALFILLLAAVNFINLSTARSSNRAKEVGIRKTLGSHRSQLVKQFLAETIILCFIALMMAVILLNLLLPNFSQLVERKLDFIAFINYENIFLIMASVITIGIIAGIYPSFVLSSFEPVKVLAKKLNSGTKSNWMRRGLIVFQFIISITFVIGTIIVTEQLYYIQNKNIGFNKEHVLIINDANILDAKIFSFKDRLLTIPNIISVSVSGSLPVESDRTLDVMCPEGIYREDGTAVNKWFVDFDYIKTMGMEIVQGRDFSINFPTDSMCVVINEAAAKQFGWDNPLGKYIYEEAPTGDDPRGYKVIGVVKNFNFESLRDNISPVGLFTYNPDRSLISARITSTDISETIAFVKKQWDEFTEGQPFEYSFLDERFNRMYKNEQKLGQALSIFSGLALFVGCLGLFGLVSFVVEQRKKEIGIRKVLGATTSNVFYIFTKETVLLILVALVVASPAAYYLMTKWLQGFAYRIDISITPFIIAGIGALLVALITISYQVIKAARTNPVNTLNYE